MRHYASLTPMPPGRWSIAMLLVKVRGLQRVGMGLIASRLLLESNLPDDRVVDSQRILGIWDGC